MATFHNFFYWQQSRLEAMICLISEIFTVVTKALFIFCGQTHEQTKFSKLCVATF